MTEEEKVDQYSRLSTDDLTKQINDDYSVILNADRANLPRALAIAPKLHALRVRAWGEWKTKFPSYGLTISYETASVYLRIWENWTEIQRLAREKSVDPTLLTIDAARELWANRKAKPDKDTAEKAKGGDGKPTPEAMEAKQAANAEEEAAKPVIDKRISWLPSTEPEVMFALLKQVYPQDKLRDLTERLASDLGMRLIPLDALEALADEVNGGEGPTYTATPSSTGVYTVR